VLDWKRLLPVKFVGGVLAIGAGLSLGREGPTVQMGAAVGKIVAEVMRLPRRSRGQLIAAGAGAGLAAAFNAPLAGFIFTLEELQREFSPLTYGTALIAAVVADIVTRWFVGQQSSFHITGYPMPSMAALPLFAVVGLLAGLVGVAFNRSLLWCLKRFHAMTALPPWARPALVGGVAGLMIWFLPEAIGGGHSTAEMVLSGHYAPVRFLSFLAILFIAKFGLTVISYASGVPGGIFAPLLVLGAILGLMTGQAGSLGFPALTQTPAAFAVVGMAAAFAAIVRAPLTGIVLILEMTNNYEQLFPLLVACMIAFLVAERMHNKPIYEALLEYDLERSGYVQHPAAREPVTMNVAVEAHSPMDGCRVIDLALPGDCLMVLIVRGGREIFPAEDTRLHSGDHLTFFIKGDAPQSCALLQAKARAE
jgi:CIC family chloride channel protein